MDDKIKMSDIIKRNFKQMDFGDENNALPRKEKSDIQIKCGDSSPSTAEKGSEVAEGTQANKIQQYNMIGKKGRSHSGLD